MNARTGTVLVVDDEASITEVYRRALETEGFAVETASDGTEAIARLPVLRDLVAVVADLSMPGADGAAVARRSRELWPRVPVVITSGWPAAAVERRASASGAAAILQKPLSLDALVGRVRSLVEDAASRS